MHTVRGLVPESLKQQLDALCLAHRKAFGRHYGETFAAVIRAGIAALRHG